MRNDGSLILVFRLVPGADHQQADILAMRSASVVFRMFLPPAMGCAETILI